MAVRLDSPSGSVSYRRPSSKMQTNNGWSTLGRSTSRQLQQTPAIDSKTMTLRRHRSRSRSAALHCLSVPELSSDEEEEEGERKEEEEAAEDDCYCYADWHQQESYQPALVVWTPGLNHHQWSRSSTPIKTATLRSALRSSITRYGD
ncbi:Uncharacterized protein APZ42_002725 [Daphnia magna]|uniref:Uncharacterized protein n=1 Tax=Daphnia magna TaxID=35525 RepID=A0A164I2V8_9CRUS|nr:Uncharacterized protein APZ42_002725 [Daphnia magna]